MTVPVWANGTTYPAGILPWSGLGTNTAPSYTYFTPESPVAAQELNYLFNLWTTRFLDKTGDSITGVVTVGAGGTIASNQTAGITANVASSIFSGVGGGITTNTVGGITSGVVGGLALTGGSTDWPVLSPARVIAETYAIRPLLGIIGSGWSGVVSVSPWGVVGTATTNLQRIELPLRHQGATLNSVTVTVFTATHSANPAIGPTIRVRKMYTGGGAATNFDLSTTATQTIAPGWPGAPVQAQLTYTCNQNNVIDTTQYVYWVEINDETGANSVAGNTYTAVAASYTVANMAF